MLTVGQVWWGWGVMSVGQPWMGTPISPGGSINSSDSPVCGSFTSPERSAHLGRGPSSAKRLHTGIYYYIFYMIYNTLPWPSQDLVIHHS